MSGKAICNCVTSKSLYKILDGKKFKREENLLGKNLHLSWCFKTRQRGFKEIKLVRDDCQSQSQENNAGKKKAN